MESSTAHPWQSFWTRVDDRLIHGQVVVAWRQYLRFDQIWVVDDEIAADSFLRDTLRLAAPAGVSVETYAVQQALQMLIAGAGKDEQKEIDQADSHSGLPLLVLVKKPQTALALVEGGVALQELNVGNLASRPGSQRAFASISLTPDHVRALDALAKRGVCITFQPAPDSARATWAKVRDKLR